MKYFIEDTTLTNIADAVREKEESAQRIPVLELAGRIRDIQTGSTVGKQLNNDGTQNVFVDDTKGDTIDTGRPIASVKYNGVDVALVGGSGEIPITANGTYDVKKYASANVNVQSAPVLLWTNASPASNFAAQTITVPVAYDGYLVEVRRTRSQGTESDHAISFINADGKWYKVSSGTYDNATKGYEPESRSVRANGNSLQFLAAIQDYNAIPARIWGVKFTIAMGV